LKSNIDKALVLKFLMLGQERDLVCRHYACQIPSFKPHMGKRYTPRYTATCLAGTQYYHISSIRNGDAASAARATDELCVRAAQPILPPCGSTLVYPLTCVELAHAYDKSTEPTLH